VWSTGTGAEIMQRIAVPMIGGMISSTLLTLIVIPAIFGLVKGLRLPNEDRLEAVPSPSEGEPIKPRRRVPEPAERKRHSREPVRRRREAGSGFTLAPRFPRLPGPLEPPQ